MYTNLHLKGIGGFGDATYWSITEGRYSWFNYIQDFGSSYGVTESTRELYDKYCFRPIRKFYIR